MNIKQFNNLKEKAKRSNTTLEKVVKDAQTSVEVETAIGKDDKDYLSKIKSLCNKNKVSCNEQYGKTRDEGITLRLTGDKQNIQTIIYQLDDDGVLVNVPRGFVLRDSIKDSLQSNISNEIKAKYPMVKIDKFRYWERLYMDGLYGKADNFHFRTSNLPDTWDKEQVRKFIEFVYYVVGKNGYRRNFSWTSMIKEKGIVKEIGWDKIEWEESIGDSIHDVDPKPNETKQEFLARFMNETKGEYPDEKQRYAVANSYWEKKGKDSIHDSYIIYSPSKEYVKRQRYAGSHHLDILESDSSIFGLKCEILSYAGGNGYGEVKISGDRNKLERFIESEFINLRKPKIQDSIKSILGDNAEIVDEDIDDLSEEEKKAIEDYKQAIAGTQDVRLLELYSHILREEIEHLRELNEAKATDSVKDWDGHDIVKLERIDERLRRNDADSWDGYLTGDEKQYIIDLLESKRMTIDKFKQVAPIIYREYGSDLEKHARDSIKDSSFENLLDGLKKYGVKYTEVPNDREYGVAYDIRYNNVAQAETIKDLAGKYGKRILSQSSGRIVVGDSIKDEWSFEEFKKNKSLIRNLEIIVQNAKRKYGNDISKILNEVRTDPESPYKYEYMRNAISKYLKRNYDIIMDW